MVRGLALLLAVAVGLGASGCRSCGSRAAVVARLGELHGGAVRAEATRPDAWSDAAQGVTFELGDAVRTQASSSARLDLTAGGALKLGEKTLVRFLAERPGTGERSVGVDTGEAEIETGAVPIEVETKSGAARFEPGSRVRVAATGGDARFDVIVGRAEIEGDGGGVTTIEANQGVVVTAGRAVLEVPDAGAPEAGAPPDAAVEAPAPSVVEAEIRGKGVRSAPSAKGTLAAVPEGHLEVTDGTRLVVPDGATVALTRGSERATIVGQADVVVGPSGGPLLETRGGRVVLTSPTAGTRIDVPGGSIVLVAPGPGTRQAQVTVDHHAAQVVAEAGQVELRGRVSTTSIGSGQSGAIDDKGIAQAEASGPTVADLSVPAGESSVIHSPRGAAAVRIRVEGACPGDALVEVAGGRGKRSVYVRADGPAPVVAMAAGSHTDRVRCLDSDGRPGEAHQVGTVQVLRDSGAVPVPRTAPHNFVDADGRHYSLLFQNLLPQITARWPRAPAERLVVLHLVPSKGAAQTFPARGSTASLPAGAIAEGEYTFWFEVDGDPMTRSPDTTLRVAFDNAAPAAEVQQPVEGQAAGDVVHVAGIAVEGATVSVAGVALPLDAAFRFKADVPAPPGERRDRSIAVRIAHPTHGVHYYLRTLGGG